MLDITQGSIRFLDQRFAIGVTQSGDAPNTARFRDEHFTNRSLRRFREGTEAAFNQKEN